MSALMRRGLLKTGFSKRGCVESVLHSEQNMDKGRGSKFADIITSYMDGPLTFDAVAFAD